jgi:adhesin HecA-like repeat protein
MKYQAILSIMQAFRLGKTRARIVGRGAVFIREGMLFNRKGVSSNTEEVRFIRKGIWINSKGTLFIQTGVLLNRKGIFSIRKEALFIRQGMLLNSKAPLVSAQAVRPSRFSYAACFFCLTRP